MRIFFCFCIGVMVMLPARVIWAQCPVASFNVQSSACLGENLKLDNTSTGATSYEWLLCSSDYQIAPAFSKYISTIGGVAVGPVYYSKFLSYNGDTYLYFIGSVSNKLYGVKIVDLATFTFTEYTTIDLSTIITSAGGFDIINENGTWIGLITRTVAPFSLVRINLSTDLKAITSFADISSGLTLATTFDVKIRKSNGNHFAFVANQTAPLAQQILRLSFGSSLSNTPVPSYIAMSSAATSANFDFYEDCGNWTGFVSSRNGKIFRMDFGSDLGNIATVTQLTLGITLDDPGGFALIREHDQFVALISSRNGPYYSLNFGASITNSSPSGTSLGNFKGTNRDWDIEVLRFGNQYKIVSCNFTSGSGGGLYSLTYSLTCDASIAYSQKETEEITFEQSGLKKVTLVALDANNRESYATMGITISTLPAPQIAVIGTDVWCVNSIIQFQYVSDINIASQEWRFGNGNQSPDELGSTQYSNAGTFNIELNVEADNGCHNVEQKIIKIYNTPLASFTLPSGLLCTNNEFTFVNTTPDNFDGNLTYQWQVDGQPAGNSRNLNVTFTSTGAKNVSLQTSIPGCSDTEVQTTSPIEAGPVVDFSVTGKCVNETTTLTNASSGSILSTQWNFGNGQLSNETSPSVNYSAPGLYPILLSITGINGCISNKTVNHRIYSLPQPDFNIDLPPFSCSGSPTQFNDLTPALTDSNLQSWLWNFNDASSTSTDRHPQYTYGNSGDYLASLTVRSDEGCENTLAKTITISPSPQPTIDYTPACEGAEVELSDGSGGLATSWRWDIEDALYFTPTAIHVFSSSGSYLANLFITGANGCQTSVLTTIVVPKKPSSVDFISEKKCVGTDALFNAQVTSSFDTIQKYEWKFGSVLREGSSATHTFTATGLQEVQLSAIGESGCVYSITKGVTVLPPPVADFAFSPEAGPPPLAVQFSNLSSNANQFKWSFNDPLSTESNIASPTFTYLALGNYPVDLIASNTEGCQSLVSKLLAVALPQVAVVLTGIQAQQGANGTIRTLITLNNNGNVSLQDIPLQMELSNGTTLQEIAPIVLRSGESATHEFGTLLLESSDLQYVCVSVVVGGNSAPIDKTRICQSFEPFTVISAPYPNPATGKLNIEWVSVIEEVIQLTIVDRMGRQIVSETIRASAGLNSRHLVVQNLQNGLYFLILKSPGANKTFRTIIAR